MFILIVAKIGVNMEAIDKQLFTMCVVHNDSDAIVVTSVLTVWRSKVVSGSYMLVDNSTF